jgi:hypothetical protein
MNEQHMLSLILSETRAVFTQVRQPNCCPQPVVALVSLLVSRSVVVSCSARCFTSFTMAWQAWHSNGTTQQGQIFQTSFWWSFQIAPW